MTCARPSRLRPASLPSSAPRPPGGKAPLRRNDHPRHRHMAAPQGGRGLPLSPRPGRPGLFKGSIAGTTRSTKPLEMSMHIRRSPEEIAANRARYEEHQKKGLEFAPKALPAKSAKPASAIAADKIVHRKSCPAAGIGGPASRPTRRCASRSTTVFRPYRSSLGMPKTRRSA